MQSELRALLEKLAFYHTYSWPTLGSLFPNGREKEQSNADCRRDFHTLVPLCAYCYALLHKTRAMADLILNPAAAVLFIAEWMKSPKCNSGSWSFKFGNWWNFLLDSDTLTLLELFAVN